MLPRLVIVPSTHAQRARRHKLLESIYMQHLLISAIPSGVRTKHMHLIDRWHMHCVNENKVAYAQHAVASTIR